MKAAALKELWLVQAFQHGCHDRCEGAVAFATEAEALDYARSWAADIPYTPSTEHEAVVFRAVATYRGRLTPVRFSVLPDLAPVREEA
jgi:hypothetical protein